MGARDIVRSLLAGVGLLEAVRSIRRRLRLMRRHRYHALVVRQYRSPFAKPLESYAAYERREREANERAVHARIESDREAVRAAARQLPGALAAAGPVAAVLASLDGAPAQAIRDNAWSEEDRRALVRAILDRVVDRDLAPRFFDYDYLDDIVGIVGGRYCGEAGCDIAAVHTVIDTLCILAEPDGGLRWYELPDALRRVLGGTQGYVPRRGDVSRYVRNVIPDLADEFITLKGENNVERFLEINREYSRRQAVQQGLWDNRELSLMRGYERDHHLLLRTLIGLIDAGHLTAQDEVLLIGPRHIDEVVFFRKTLGLPKTIGLDLFPFGKDEIVAGDMHKMSFESDRFRLVYCAGTLSYSYNARRVIEEIARVMRRPGFVFIVDGAGRKAGPDALGRSDVVGIDTLLGMFYRHTFQVLAKDPGRSLTPESYENEPCLALRLTGEQAGWPATPSVESEQSGPVCRFSRADLEEVQDSATGRGKSMAPTVAERM
jgi:SAM-dependent methyltransferase